MGAGKRRDEYGRAPQYGGTSANPADMMKAIRNPLNPRQEGLIAQNEAIKEQERALDELQKPTSVPPF